MQGLRSTWRNISAYVQAVMDAARLNSALAIDPSDQFTARNDYFLMPAFRDAWTQILGFCRANKGVLPPTATQIVEDYQLILEQLVINKSATPTGLLDIINAVCAARSRLDFVLSASEEPLKRLVERAFVHLQRAIIVDADVAKKWQSAFAAARAEESCERLGAIHLLSHGVWAFKAYSEKERTDLILGTPVDVGEAERSAEAMVLTEWKVARTEVEVQSRAEQARRQARIYSGSSLAGFELCWVRYLVIVTSNRLPMPPDQREGDILYRVTNVAVDPSTPSKVRGPANA